jgi:hypothetical protein
MTHAEHAARTILALTESQRERFMVGAAQIIERHRGGDLPMTDALQTERLILNAQNCDERAERFRRLLTTWSGT